MWDNRDTDILPWYFNTLTDCENVGEDSWFCFPDTLSKEEFNLKQNVEPFIHYKEKQATFECITREHIEAVAAKVSFTCFYDLHLPGYGEVLFGYKFL